MNDDLDDNRKHDKDLIERGEKYHWHEGEGIIFDDNYLHDAANESDEVRVVLWLDMRGPMPFYASIFNKLVLWFVGRDASVETIGSRRAIASRRQRQPAARHSRRPRTPGEPQRSDSRRPAGHRRVATSSTPVPSRSERNRDLAALPSKTALRTSPARSTFTRLLCEDQHRAVRHALIVSVASLGAAPSRRRPR